VRERSLLSAGKFPPFHPLGDGCQKTPPIPQWHGVPVSILRLRSGSWGFSLPLAPLRRLGPTVLFAFQARAFVGKARLLPLFSFFFTFCLHPRVERFSGFFFLPETSEVASKLFVFCFSDDVTHPISTHLTVSRCRLLGVPSLCLFS